MGIRFARLWGKAKVAHDDERPIMVVKESENVWRIVWADEVFFNQKTQ